jgi:uncharacterized protein YbjQ (UPF0145 family)
MRPAAEGSSSVPAVPMGFFRSAGRSDGEPERDDDAPEGHGTEQADALARIEAGGIPLSAERRLKALGTDGSLFTSGLSVNEFSLLSALGPRPLAQVMGGSVVRLGQALLPGVPTSRRWTSFGGAGGYSTQPGEPTGYQKSVYQRTTMVLEVEVLTNAWMEAQRNALNRLSEEALQVGADVVVGVELRRGEQDLAKRTIDYLISGTAIRLSGSTQTNWPLLSDLSVQDYWRLHEAGYEPAGLVAATSVVFASASRPVRRKRRRTVRRNQELTELSQAFHLARDTVRQRLLSQAQGLRAAGTVGVALTHTIHEEELTAAPSLQAMSPPGWNRGVLGIPYYVRRKGDADREGWLITMHGAGTAIRRREVVTQYPPEKTMRLGGK